MRHTKHLRKQPLNIKGSLPVYDKYAAEQRRIRSLQPKVSSEEAHAQARRVLLAAQRQNQPR